MFKRILVPVDFSSHSQTALDYAVELGRQSRAELELLHVVEPIYYAVPDFAGGATATLPTLIDEQLKAAREQLARLEREYGKRRVRVRGFLQTGTPHQAIVDTAKRRKADLIVMSTHGRTGLAHVLLGSVAERVVRSAPSAVLTVRADLVRKRKRRKSAARK